MQTQTLVKQECKYGELNKRIIYTNQRTIEMVTLIIPLPIKWSYEEIKLYLGAYFQDIKLGVDHAEIMLYKLERQH